MHTPIFVKSYETFISSLYIKKLILFLFTEFQRSLVLLSIFNSNVVNTSLNHSEPILKNLHLFLGYELYGIEVLELYFFGIVLILFEIHVLQIVFTFNEHA